MDYVIPTYEELLKRMLDRIPSDVDKREGSIIFDAIAPAALELENLYLELSGILSHTYADTATGEYLDLRAKERGIKRAPATRAIVKGVFTPASVNVLGKRFNCGEFNYTVMESASPPGTYLLQCEEPGARANNQTGSLIPIEYIQDLETAAIVSVSIPGEDVESDDSLRKRYYQTLDSKSFGGNIADYKDRVSKINGVGGVKVTPVWNGGGTVKLTIIDSAFKAPDSDLVSRVQNIVDPPESGTGKGIVPIGHVVTVDGVKEKSITIDTEIAYQSGFNWSTSGNFIKTAIDKYFSDLCRAWQDSQSLIVRISQVEMGILGCNGVLDVGNTKLNNSTSNLQLGPNEIPKRGAVNGS